MKKTLLFFLLAIFMSSSFCAYAKISVIDENFESYTQGSFLSSPWVAGETRYTSGNKTRGLVQVKDGNKYLRITPLSEWAYYSKVPVNTESEIYRISYDFMIDNAVDSLEYLDFKVFIPSKISEDGSHTTEGLRLSELRTVNDDEGKRHVYIGSENCIKSYGSVLDHKKSGTKELTDEDVWHNITLFIDLENRKETVYFDNELWYAERGLPDAINDIKYIALWAVADKDGKSIAAGVDNFKVEALSNSDILTLKNNNELCPEYLKAGLSAKITSSNVGNIFFDKNIAFNVKLNNYGNFNTDIVNISIYDKDNRCIHSENKAITVDAGRENEFSFNYTMPRFGVFNLTVSEGKGRGTSTIPFSVCNIPSEGVKNSDYGIDTDFSSDNRGEVDELMSILEKAGFGIIREQFTWQTLDSDGSGFKMTDKYNRFIELSQDGGSDILAIASFGNTNYLNGTPPETDAEMDYYAAYCKDLVEELSGKAGYIEIWNEYMLSGFNNKGLPPEKYAHMLVKAYDAIRMVNKDIKICSMVLPGMTETVQSGSVLVDTDGDGVGEKLSPLQWLRMVLDELKNMNRLDVVEVVSLHSYMDSYPDDMDNLILSHTNGVKKTLESYGLFDIPLVISESGWTTHYDYIDEDMQANSLVRMGILNDIYKMFDKYVIFNVQRFADDKTVRDANFGILNYMEGIEANNARPAFAAICNMNKMTGEATPIGVVDRNDEVRMFEYKTKDNNTMYAIWTIDGKNNVEIPVGVPYVVLCDMYGNESLVNSYNGKVKITAQKDICYVIVPTKDAYVSDISGNVLDFINENQYIKVVSKNPGLTKYDVFAKKQKNNNFEYFADLGDIHPTLNCKTELVPGAVLQIDKTYENANYSWEYKKAGEDTYTVIDNQNDYKLTVPNICADCFVRIKVTKDEKEYYSADVYIGKKSTAYREWVTPTGSVEYSPDEVLFTCDGMTFAFLEAEDGEVFVTIAEANDKNSRHLWNTAGVQEFNPESEASIAHFVNTEYFKDKNIPKSMQIYLNNHSWILETSAAMGEQSFVESEVSLISYNEYLKHIGKVGYKLKNNTGVALNGQSFRTMSEKNNTAFVCNLNAPQIRTLFVTENNLLYPRAVFYLDEEFFKSVKLQNLGEDVKEYILENFESYELTNLYSAEELAEIGYDIAGIPVRIYGECNVGGTVFSKLNGVSAQSYMWQYSDHAYGPFVDLEDETEINLTVKEKYAYDGYVRLKVISDSDKFYSNVLKIIGGKRKHNGWQDIRNVGKNDDFIFSMESDPEKEFVILDKHRIGNKNYYYVLKNDYDSNLNGIFANDLYAKLNPGVSGNAAYTMNTDEFIKTAVAYGMEDYILSTDWDVISIADDTYSINCKLMLISAANMRNYPDKVLWDNSANWWVRDQATVFQKLDEPMQTYFTPTDLSYIRTSNLLDYNDSLVKFNLRPVFYLSEDYFKDNRVDINSAGNKVLDMLANDFSKEQLLKIYSEEEFGTIYQNSESEKFPVGDFNLGATGKTEFFVFEQESLKPLSDKIELN